MRIGKGMEMCVITMSNDFADGDEGRERVFTAREYLKTFDPNVYQLLLDPEQACLDAATEAAKVAASLSHHYRRAAPAYPEPVWRIVFG